MVRSGFCALQGSRRADTFLQACNLHSLEHVVDVYHDLFFTDLVYYAVCLSLLLKYIPECSPLRACFQIL